MGREAIPVHRTRRGALTTLAPQDPERGPVILAVTQGGWGERIADNLHRFHPPEWTVHRWPAPRALPPVIDDPADYIPSDLPRADLLLALGESASFGPLIPDLVAAVGARSVIAPIDRNESLPPGLVRQLQGWLGDLGVAAVFPKPFCSLTETSYNHTPIQVDYDDPLIREFAARFGRPRFRVSVDSERRIGSVDVERDTACGCARHVAQALPGVPVDQASFEAGMLHHHYPCLASMNQDSDYHDTLMHVSGHLMREAVETEIQDHLEPPRYFQPQGRA